MMNYGYGYNGGYWGAGILFMLFWLFVLAVIIGLIVWAIVAAERRRNGHHGAGQHQGYPNTPGQFLPGQHPAPHPPGGQQPQAGQQAPQVQQGEPGWQPGGPQPGQPGHDEAMAIARRRLANGEITPEQFQEIRQHLEG
jgi:uncharacterized membrane protein